ncbi:protein SMAX1-LIKE 3 isoform X2 [Cryptomeria japonica]|uniref:protein SMAX1-LIKE 3 isoform X2 n=1 Tax=Cryptomeria japonica TaxID=3369 RepID=UPI0025AC5976|nr:protein SMAX1-LIKE 3 isoform X2 [Cryptomeria japonica]
MRAGGCTVQHTLTVEAAAAVRSAVGLARRRGHAQATPLHVAVMLLGSESSLLRRACLRSHPLQWRALEVCFNVALNRLPAAAGAGQPSLSNALIAALKRAQANQRRGCIEQQQAQPLLGVKVEIEQLVISILDDPSVSRVMREAGFYSPNLKYSLENNTHLSYSLQISGGGGGGSVGSGGGGGLLSMQAQNCRAKEKQYKPSFSKDMESLVEALAFQKRKTTVIVGDEPFYTECILRQLFTRIESGDIPDCIKNVQVIGPQIFSCLHCSRDELERKLSALNTTVASCCLRGVILYVGDLRWTLEMNQNFNRSSCCSYSPVEIVIREVGRMLACYGDRLWLLGCATYETYIKCKMRQPTLESLWKLQPLTVPTGGLSLALHHSSTAVQDAKMVGGEVYPCKDKPHFDKLKATSLDFYNIQKLNSCHECSKKLDSEDPLLLHHNNSVANLYTQIQGTSSTLPSFFQRQHADQISTVDLTSLEAQISSESVRELGNKWNQNCGHESQIPFSCSWNMCGDSMLKDSKLQLQSSINESIRNNGDASKLSWNSDAENLLGPDRSVIWSSTQHNIENSTKNFFAEDNTCESNDSKSRLEVQTALTLGRSSSNDSDNNTTPNKRNRTSNDGLWWQNAQNCSDSVSASVGTDD